MCIFGGFCPCRGLHRLYVRCPSLHFTFVLVLQAKKIRHAERQQAARDLEKAKYEVEKATRDADAQHAAEKSDHGAEIDALLRDNAKIERRENELLKAKVAALEKKLKKTKKIPGGVLTLSGESPSQNGGGRTHGGASFAGFQQTSEKPNLSESQTIPTRASIVQRGISRRHTGVNHTQPGSGSRGSKSPRSPRQQRRVRAHDDSRRDKGMGVNGLANGQFISQLVSQGSNRRVDANGGNGLHDTNINATVSGLLRNFGMGLRHANTSAALHHTRFDGATRLSNYFNHHGVRFLQPISRFSCIYDTLVFP
jgi:hypothetical protein